MTSQYYLSVALLTGRFELRESQTQVRDRPIAQSDQRPRHRIFGLTRGLAILPVMLNRRSGVGRIQLFPPLRVLFSPSPQAALLTLRRIRAENRFSVGLATWGAGSLFLIIINVVLGAASEAPPLGIVMAWGAVVLLDGLRVYRGGRKKYRSRLRALVSEEHQAADPAAETADVATLRTRLLESGEEVRDALRPVSPEHLAEVSRGETHALALVSWLDDAERLILDHRVERELRRTVADRLSETHEPSARAAQEKLLALLDRYQQQLGAVERQIRDHRSRAESFLLALDNVKIAHAGSCDVAAAAAPLVERAAWLAEPSPAAGASATLGLPAMATTDSATTTDSAAITDSAVTKQSVLTSDAAARDAHWREEVRLAQDLQRSILPAAAPQVRGLDVAHVYRPSSEIGGDFYDFYLTGEGRLLVALGDASGHGLDSSMVSSMAKSALYMQVSSGRAPGPDGLATALAEINRMMWDTLGRHRLMTLTLVEFDTLARTISWVNAGQVYPLLRRNGEVSELEQPGYPLGVRREVNPQVQQQNLEPGDLLVMLTDGYVEAANDADEPFGWQRLTANLAASPTVAPTDLLDELSHELNGHLQDRSAQDDVTLIALSFQS